MDKALVELIKSGEIQVVYIAIALLFMVKIFELYTTTKGNKEHKKIFATLDVFKGLFADADVRAKRIETKSIEVNHQLKKLITKASLDEGIDEIVQNNLQYFRSSRMRHHLFINGELIKGVANKIIRMKIETLSETQLKHIFEEIQHEHQMIKEDDVDTWLLEDYYKQTKRKCVNDYMHEIIGIAHDKRNSYTSRFIRLTLTIFDRIVAQMDIQYKRLLLEDFDFQDEKVRE